MITVNTACLPTSANHLIECYGSLLDQTYINWNWIIVFDGSVNGVVNQNIMSVLEADPRITTLVLPRNVGAANARNIGIVSAKPCSIIRNLDADDLLRPHALESDVEALSKPDIEWSTSHSSVFSETVPLQDFPLFRKTGIIHKQTLAKQFVKSIENIDIHFTTLAGYRETLLRAGGYRAITHGEDILLGIALNEIATGWFNEKPSVNYRKWTNQLTSTGRTVLDELFLQESIQAILK